MGCVFVWQSKYGASFSGAYLRSPADAPLSLFSLRSPTSSSQRVVSVYGHTGALQAIYQARITD